MVRNFNSIGDEILIRADGKQAVINKGTGQIIDFYNYTSSSGHVDVVRVQLTIG